jgi:PHP family Zn ribbon phosphoesterase
MMLDQILALPNGARFYKCDLHTHTPKDGRFNCGGWPVQTKEEKQAFARELVRYARQMRALDILGVTEHNDVSWLPYIQEAAEEVELIVFSGVELGALAGQKNIHFLALFDPGTPAEKIDHWLSSLKLTPGKRFHSDNSPRAVQKHAHELTEVICQDSDGLSGIAIAAHASGPSGLFEGMQGEGRVLAYIDPRLLAVEIPGSREELCPFEGALVSGELKDYQYKKVACLNHSDGRCLEDRDDLPAIGSKATYFKLSSPTVEGLRQAFIDFESRVRLEGERLEERYPHLVGVAIEGGFLQGKGNDPFLLHINPNLNCVIGGRGAGKSALLEALRYAFDIPAKTEANQKQADELLRNTLGAGAKVTVFYETDDGTLYRIERIWGQEPRVFDARTDEEKPGLQPRRVVSGDPIDVYGQKEVYEISKDPEFQLRLLDNYVADDLRPIQEQERDLIRRLEINAQDILRLEREIEEASEKLQDLPAIREELERLERKRAIARLEQKKQLEQEKAMLEQAGSAVEELAAETKAFAMDYGISPDLLGEQARADLPHADLLASQRSLLDEVGTTFHQAIDDLPARLRAVWQKGEEDRIAWQKDYEREEEAYQKLLREVPDASAERYINLQRQRNALEQLEKEVKRRQVSVAELKAERQRMLEALRRLRREEAFRVRQEKAQELDGLLGTAISISVILEGNRDAYAEYLLKSWSGSGVRMSIIESIAKAAAEDGTYYSPIHLVAAIRKERENPPEAESVLAQIYDVSEAFRRRLASLPDETLYKLETYSVPDLPVIKLRVGDRDKPLADLSVGQKCTAVLSLILGERKTPLVIDQPEDDLDNRFIFDEIVQTLRREKERRQFVIATHNANIPVSGDAELIIVLDADEEHGWVACLGSIDDPVMREPVENILEGGREAFRIRKEKYGV